MDNTKTVGKELGRVISIDEEQIKSLLGEIGRDTVEETLSYYYFRGNIDVLFGRIIRLKEL